MPQSRGWEGIKQRGGKGQHAHWSVPRRASRRPLALSPAATSRTLTVHLALVTEGLCCGHRERRGRFRHPCCCHRHTRASTWPSQACSPFQDE